MLERLKKGLVESFVGAIGLGWLLADIVQHFANIFASPLAGWITRGEFPEISIRGSMTRGFLLRVSLPELVRTVLLAVIWYALLYWLYIRSQKDPVPEGESSRPNPA